MSAESVAWIWNAPGWARAAGLLLFGFYLFFTFVHLRRGLWQRRRVLTELLKSGGACLLLLTLWQPEIHRRHARHQSARIAVIRDRTESMETGDVATASNMVSRAAWVDGLLATEAWTSLAAAVKLEFIDLAHGDEGVRQTDLAAGIALSREVPELAGVLLLSDGAHNADAPPLPEALRLAERGVPLFAVEIGRETRLPDLLVEPLDFPSYVLAREPLSLPVRVRGTLPEGANVRVKLLADGQVVSENDLRVEAESAASTVLRWMPPAPGKVDLAVVIDSHPLDLFPGNNRRSALVDVRETLLRVLLIDSLPRWEYRYLRNALTRDPGVRVDSLLFHPSLGVAAGPGYLPRFPRDGEDWSAYDVVFVGDVGVGSNELAREDTEILAELVREQGSGLVFLPGPRGGHLRLANTALEALMPVEMDAKRAGGVGFDQEMRFTLTREGRDHLLTQLHADPARNLQVWRQLPGFHWFSPVLRARVGSEVLATHATQRNEHGRLPLLVTRETGAGKTLFLGTDSAWRWRLGLEDVYHYRFWGQVVRWMAHKRHMFSDEGARIFLQPERPMAGRPVQVTVSLRSAWLDPKRVPVSLRMTSANGEVQLPALSAQGGVFTATWTPPVAGSARMELVPAEGMGEPLFASDVQVEGVGREELGVPLRPALLRELARATGGKSVATADAVALLAELEALPRQQQVLGVRRLWQDPLWCAGVFLLFGVYWILRKRQGWM
jgi:uncharacterized membrane protein